MIDFAQKFNIADVEKSKFLAMIVDRRFKEETRGILYDGFKIETTRDSQSLLSGAALSAMLDDSYSCLWKTTDGWVTFDSKQLIEAAKSVRAHVQKCFEREHVLEQSVKLNTFTLTMLDTGW